MLEMTYCGLKTKYLVAFQKISENIVELQGDFPKKEHGFILSRKEKDDNWDYSSFKTIFREDEGKIQFSNDGSIYQPPSEPEPFVPTLEQVQEEKVSQMNQMQQLTISNGVDVVMTDGTTKHFSLTPNDQSSIMGSVSSGIELPKGIPWHVADESIQCTYFSEADMKNIARKAYEYVLFHVTYFRDLRIYIRSLDSIEEVNEITYGYIIPPENRSEVLADMYASIGND